MLLETKADVNKINDSNNTTSMLVAAKKNYLKIMKLLVDYGFNFGELINVFDKKFNLSVFLSLSYHCNRDGLGFLIRHCSTAAQKSKTLKKDEDKKQDVDTANYNEKESIGVNPMQVDFLEEIVCN